MNIRLIIQAQHTVMQHRVYDIVTLKIFKATPLFPTAFRIASPAYVAGRHPQKRIKSAVTYGACGERNNPDQSPPTPDIQSDSNNDKTKNDTCCPVDTADIRFHGRFSSSLRFLEYQERYLILEKIAWKRLIPDTTPSDFDVITVIVIVTISMLVKNDRHTVVLTQQKLTVTAAALKRHERLV